MVNIKNVCSDYREQLFLIQADWRKEGRRLQLANYKWFVGSPVRVPVILN